MSKNSITITGLDLLKAMENAQTPLNPFLIKKDMIYTSCTICGCMPKHDEWSGQVQGVCFDCG